MEERGKFESNEPKLERFREAVRKQFGRHLEKATPANVREFMDHYQEEVFPGPIRGRFELNETKTTYEEILKDFFANVLERPTDEALIMLWTLAFDLSFFNIEQHAAVRLQTLFGDGNE
ncbi:MAG TPA: hypothetical protein VKU00_02045 [Chthonomonadaceae bacterium]|nr:hypothetical protein [Chthonomonadaceae bacterium]